MSESSVNSVTKSGNTRQISPSKYWCFTLNNYSSDDLKKLDECNSVDKYIFQEEVGETGTPHLQGFVQFDNRVRPKNIVDFSKAAHWEKKKGTIAQNIAYCSKTSSRKPESLPFCRGFVLPKSPRIITVLREFQKTIVDKIREVPDDRTIHWFWESRGKIGKSSLTRYLVFHHNALVCSGKATDMKYLIVKYYEKHGSYPELIVFDVPRTSEKFLSYQGIEEIKNGCFANTKYECDTVLIDFPHVVVFANFPPETSKMSADRWSVVNLRPMDAVLEELIIAVWDRCDRRDRDWET